MSQANRELEMDGGTRKRPDPAAAPVAPPPVPLESLTTSIDAAPGCEQYWPYMPFFPPTRTWAPYKSGEINRLNKDWVPWHWSGESAVVQNWDVSTARLRDLGRNDPCIVALKRALLDHVVGTGISTTAAVFISQDETADDFDEESDRLFQDWCELGTEADSEGKLSEPELQRQGFSELLETGECLAMRVSDNRQDRLVPLCYQMLEAEQLDRWKDRLPGLMSDGTRENEIRAGIEYDERHRIVAYWLYKTNPYDIHARFPGVSFRVPADRIIHFALPGRPSATRSLGLYNSIVQSARDLDNYIGSELTSAVIESLFSIVHKTKTPGHGLGLVGDGWSDPGNTGSDLPGGGTVRLGRGIVSQIPLGDELETVTKQRTAQNAKTFTDLLLMLIGMGGGCSRYRLTKDYSGTTYIAARASGNDDTKGFRPLQRFFGRQWSLRVRQEWTRQMAALGRFSTLTATQFERQRRRWSRCQIQYPGVEQLDAVAETNAATARIGTAQSTLEAEVARTGGNWRHNIRQRAREQRYAAEQGLVLDFTRPGTASTTAGATANGDAEDQADGK